ncbi:hypothetical protein JCM11251_001069 [Rhodosporidiobolus azoricus]
MSLLEWATLIDQLRDPQLRDKLDDVDVDWEIVVVRTFSSLVRDRSGDSIPGVESTEPFEQVARLMAEMRQTALLKLPWLSPVLHQLLIFLTLSKAHWQKVKAEPHSQGFERYAQKAFFLLEQIVRREVPPCLGEEAAEQIREVIRRTYGMTTVAAAEQMS